MNKELAKKKQELMELHAQEVKEREAAFLTDYEELVKKHSMRLEPGLQMLPSGNQWMLNAVPIQED